METSGSLLRKFINRDRSVDSFDLVVVLSVFCLAKQLGISVSNRYWGKRFSEIYELLVEKIEYENRIVFQKAWSVLSQSLIWRYDPNLIGSISEYFESFEEMDCKDIIDTLFLDYEKSSGKYRGIAIDPQEITNLALNLCSANSLDKVYDPFSGLASNITVGAFDDFYSQEIDPTIWALSVIRLLVHGLNPLNSVNEDSLQNWNSFGQKYDLIITTPPFGFKLNQFRDFRHTSYSSPSKTIEEYIINQGLSDLKPTGKLAILIDAKFLNETRSNATLRKWLIDKDLIEYLVLLPSGILFNSAIATCLLILNTNKQRRAKVTLFDASTLSSNQNGINSLDLETITDVIKNQDTKYVKVVGKDNFVVNGYDFSFNLYFSAITNLEIPSGYQIVMLSEILTPVKKTRANEEILGRLIKVANLSSDPISFEINVSQLETVEITRNFFKLENSAILLSRRFNRLKPSYCFSSFEAPVFLIPEIEAFELIGSKIYLPYLIKELSSDSVQKQLEYMSYGVMPSIKREDLLKIQILVPDFEKQKEIIEQTKLEKIKELGLEIDEIKNSLKDEYEKKVRFRKHAIGQEVFELKNLFSSIMKFKSKNNGLLRDDMMINPMTDTSIKGCFESMGQTIETIREMVDNIAEDYFYGIEEKIDLLNFLEDYCNKSGGPNFVMEFTHTYFVAEEDKYMPDIEEKYNENGEFVGFFQNGEILLAKAGEVVAPPQVLISKDSFRQILSNVRNNAIKHGFTSTERSDYKIVISVEHGNNGTVVINISNNGNPLKEGMTEDSFFINSRHGNVEIKDRVEHNKGSIKLEADSNSEFPVKLVMTFKDESILMSL